MDNNQFMNAFQNFVQQAAGQSQSNKVFIKNNSKSILLLQNNKKEVFCKLEPKQVSIEAFDKQELRTNVFIQKLLQNNMITLMEERVEEPKPVYRNYGQKYLIGQRCEIKGEHHLIINIVQYLPETGQYRCKLEKTGGVMILTEREIIPLSKEVINKENNIETVDVVVNQEGKVKPEAKNVKDIMKDALNELNDEEQYQTPEIITVENQKDYKEMIDKEVNIQAEQDIEAEKQLQKRMYGNKMPNNEVIQPLPQEPEEDLEENIYIMRNKDINQKFAKEVKASKVINDTMTAQQKILQEELGKVKVAEKKNEDQLNVNEIPSQFRKWFLEFLKKDERKKKIAISTCKDVNKLNLIIKFCGEYEQNLAKQKLALIGK